MKVDEEYNPYEDNTDEFFLYEQAKIANITANIIKENMKPNDNVGIGFITKLEGEASAIMEVLDGKSD